MKATNDFLNDIKLKYNLKSNYALARLMGQTDTAIARWTHGKNTLSDESALQVAALLEIDPAYVVACVHAERAKDATLKRLWERVATMTAGVSAALLVAWLAPFPAGAEYGLMASLSLSNVYYVKSLFEYWPLMLPLCVLAVVAYPARRK